MADELSKACPPHGSHSIPITTPAPDKIVAIRESRTGVEIAKPEPHGPHLRLWVGEIHSLNAHYIWGGFVAVGFLFSSSSQITTLVFNQLHNHALSKKLLLYLPLPILPIPQNNSNQTSNRQHAIQGRRPLRRNGLRCRRRLRL